MADLKIGIFKNFWFNLKIKFWMDSSYIYIGHPTFAYAIFKCLSKVTMLVEVQKFIKFASFLQQINFWFFIPKFVLQIE